MKLATLASRGRDGELCVVSRDLSYFVNVSAMVPSLQAALDNWHQHESLLQDIYQSLNENSIDAEPLDVNALNAPLPRAYQWLDGSAYVNHVALVRKARGAEMPENFWTDPLMYQGASDVMLGPSEEVPIRSEAYGIDFEAELVAICDDVPMGIDATAAGGRIRLFTVVNDISLRNLIPDELAKGFGFLQSKPASSFSPVAVTPDELGDAWDGSKVSLEMHSWLNGALFGKPNTGEDMIFDFPTLIAHAAKTRHLSAGTLIGSGTISNQNQEVGSSCIMEKRMLEIIEHGEASTSFMRFEDKIRIEARSSAGESIFGAIDQKIVEYCVER